MHKSSKLAICLIAVGLAACSQDATSPVLDPQFAKDATSTNNGNGNQKGNAHFVLDETGCSLAENGGVDCRFKIAGLAKNANVVTTLSAGIKVTYNCVNPAQKEPPAWQNRTLSATASVTHVAEQSGVVIGSLRLDFGGAMLGLMDGCPNTHWTYRITGFDQTSTPTLKWLVNGVTLLVYAPQY